MSLPWSERFAVGIRAVDHDHQRIFDAVAQLETAAEQGQFSSSFSHTLDFLTDYVKEHFRREEKIMMEYNYPGYYRHKQLHDEFKEIIYCLRVYLNVGEKPIDAAKVIQFLNDWLVHHITKVDVKLGLLHHQTHAPLPDSRDAGRPSAVSRGTRRSIQLAIDEQDEHVLRNIARVLRDNGEEADRLRAQFEDVQVVPQDVAVGLVWKLFAPDSGKPIKRSGLGGAEDEDGR